MKDVFQCHTEAKASTFHLNQSLFPSVNEKSDALGINAKQTFNVRKQWEGDVNRPTPSDFLVQQSIVFNERDESFLVTQLKFNSLKFI